MNRVRNTIVETNQVVIDEIARKPKWAETFITQVIGIKRGIHTKMRENVIQEGKKVGKTHEINFSLPTTPVLSHEGSETKEPTIQSPRLSIQYEKRSRHFLFHRHLLPFISKKYILILIHNNATTFVEFHFSYSLLY